MGSTKWDPELAKFEGGGVLRFTLKRGIAVGGSAYREDSPIYCSVAELQHAISLNPRQKDLGIKLLSSLTVVGVAVHCNSVVVYWENDLMASEEILTAAALIHRELKLDPSPPGAYWRLELSESSARLFDIINPITRRQIKEFFRLPK